MRSEMPTLGRSRKRPTGRIFVVLGLVAIVGLFVFWRVHRRAAAAHAVAAAPATPARTAAATPTPPPPAHAVAAAETPDGGVAATRPPPVRSAADAELEKAGLKRVRVEVDGPLETAVVREVGADLGQRLVQVLVRSLVWWIAVPNDLRKGDVLEALYKEQPNEDPIIYAIRFQSLKNGHTYRAYRFKSTDSAWPRIYDPEGGELELRLTHAPLDDYEQVTSLLRDGRGHKGVDFKTPLGTPVKAPFDAVVVKKNWHWRGNGNSIELRETGGHGWTAIFLHLAEPASPAIGARVSRGDVLGKSGNTGHSFAPHLHYQLMSGKKVLDPFAVQETYRKKLSDKEKAPFQAEVARLDHLLDLK